MREYSIMVPIAGHAFVVVNAESEEEAKEKAFDTVSIEHIESWEALEQFNRGNVCYCPSPWEIQITDEGEVEE